MRYIPRFGDYLGSLLTRLGQTSRIQPEFSRRVPLQMQPTPEETKQALITLLSAVAGSSLVADAKTKPVAHQIDLSIDRTKADASEGAALIDACAPQGRAMLTQAQKRLEQLQALKVLETFMSESFGLL